MLLRSRELREEVGAAEERHRELMLQKKDLAVEADTVKTSGVQLEPRLTELQQKITECDNMVSQARKNEADALMPYGKNIKEVVKKIQGMKWYGDVPIGPLGVHVKAREPEKWGEILRVQLGVYLTAFAVTDARDRGGGLRGFWGSLGSEFFLVCCFWFWRSFGRLRVCKEAQQALMSLGRGGTAWSADGFNVRVFRVLRSLWGVVFMPCVCEVYFLSFGVFLSFLLRALLAMCTNHGENREGGVASSPLNMRGLQGAMNLLLTGRDTVSEIWWVVLSLVSSWLGLIAVYKALK
ncbi:uncharacterized protein LACBIDRAFT_306583 [Laccaria bicolor S238N-H82]|uniref:Predicted protein n=1 Tax=Laccaria bicolor (strain S238N-H82 / ATCC MYA-4686) TaxID=486041 RepID=B0DND1_LACBS|nr:uncharacterized protein LACBIDRAFT_306583 [Laccaria bicolor S238N-H82]EDR03918.1 predicted protein [Laccaria bicolor S238N-H82]|eukprot:XP_001885486.1 predicted protein [Laccaria bicolor S238N-H82]